jgi:hypothetical protein
MRAAGGGRGALGSWMGAVALLAMTIGAVGTRAVAAPAGVTETVMGRGTGVVPVVEGTGVVSSFGWVSPAPGRALKVMRTVSFFRGTAEVLATGAGGGVGCVLFSSLMTKMDARSRW